MKNLVKVFALCILSLFTCTCISCNAANRSDFCTPSTVRASHILVNTKSEADQIEAKIKNGESFESLAQQYSKCPSGQNGGDLGYFGRGQMVQPFEDVAFELPVGQVSNPIHTQFGWHIIKVYDKK